MCYIVFIPRIQRPLRPASVFSMMMMMMNGFTYFYFLVVHWLYILRTRKLKNKQIEANISLRRKVNFFETNGIFYRSRCTRNCVKTLCRIWFLLTFKLSSCWTVRRNFASAQLAVYIIIIIRFICLKKQYHKWTFITDNV